MKNIKLAIGIGSLLTLVVGAYITREKWMPLLVKPKEEEIKTEDVDVIEDKVIEEKHTKEIKVSSPEVAQLGVYAKYKNTDIKLADKGNTVENVIVLGKSVRKTEGANENLGKFIKYITIFATPFVLFTDSYSGRNVLVSKSAVTIK